MKLPPLNSLTRVGGLADDTYSIGILITQRPDIHCDQNQGGSSRGLGLPSIITNTALNISNHHMLPMHFMQSKAFHSDSNDLETEL